MSSEYNSAARSLALPLSPHRSPDRAPLRPSWPRSQSDLSRTRSNSHGQQSIQQQAMETEDRLQRRAVRLWRKLSLVQQIALGAVVMTTLVVSVLFLVFNERIFAWMEPYAQKWKELKGGWLILWFLTFATAFPPLIGYSTCVTISGFVYGFPNGWFIVATANVAGSLGSFLVFRNLLSNFAHRLVASDKRFAALSLVLKHDGLKLLVMIRMCPLPYSLSNGAISTFNTVSPLMFALATAIASPKLLIHVFIGSRLAAIARSGDEGRGMDAGTKAINWASIILGSLLGVVTGFVIYRRTVARARQLEAEERSKLEQRARGLSHPDNFADDIEDGLEQREASDEIDFLDAGPEDDWYRDDPPEGTDMGEDEENSIGMEERIR